jgi:hypothetical protein
LRCEAGGADIARKKKKRKKEKGNRGSRGGRSSFLGNVDGNRSAHQLRRRKREKKVLRRD